MKTLVFAIGISLLAGFVGSVATTPAIPGWYADLVKPSFNPPNWIFGPVWTLLYILMGTSLYLVIVKKTKKSKQRAYYLFAAQLILNTLWSIVFFGMQNVGLALVVIVVLWSLIVATIMEFKKFDKRASYLLVPYILWVSFATILNFSIWQLN